MIINRYLLVIVFLGFAFGIEAQQLDNKVNQDSLTTWQLIKYDTNTTLKSIKYSFTRPLDWKGKDFTKFGALVLGTVALSAADEGVNDFFVRQKDDFPKAVRDFGWYFGSPQNYFIANAGLYSFGLLTKNENVRKTSILIISSSVTTGLILSLSKSTFGRARPTANLGAHEFSLFSSEPKFHSFPSGHTGLSVTMAHAIAKQFDNVWVKAGIYTIGAIPPISRLIDGAHWLTDITFSAALSIIVVDGIDKFLFNNDVYNYKERANKISWNLKFGANQVGFVGTF